jgi:hypothetical protein
MLLSNAYHSVVSDLESQAEEYARMSCKICLSEDGTFDETYGKLLRGLAPKQSRSHQLPVQCHCGTDVQFDLGY